MVSKCFAGFFEKSSEEFPSVRNRPILNKKPGYEVSGYEVLTFGSVFFPDSQINNKWHESETIRSGVNGALRGQGV